MASSATLLLRKYLPRLDRTYFSAELLIDEKEMQLPYTGPIPVINMRIFIRQKFLSPRRQPFSARDKTHTRQSSPETTKLQMAPNKQEEKNDGFLMIQSQRNVAAAPLEGRDDYGIAVLVWAKSCASEFYLRDRIECSCRSQTSNLKIDRGRGRGPG